MKRAAALALAVLLAACAGDKPRERPPRAQQVVELGQQGQAAYRKGDLARAARLFAQALNDALRIEDSAAVAVMSLNLARVMRESGDSAGALQLLAAVSPWHRGAMAPASAADLDLLAAVLLADLARRDEALARLDALRERCQAACALDLAIDSLKARLLLEQGAAGPAAQLASATIARFGPPGNQLELANLLRVEGEARLARGDFAAARQSLESALAIDKAQGQPGKIAQDLDALARAALAAGDAPAHAAYRARLAEVRLARAPAAAK